MMAIDMEDSAVHEDLGKEVKSMKSMLEMVMREIADLKIFKTEVTEIYGHDESRNIKRPKMSSRKRR